MMTDFHSHILPQIDDGSTGLEMSIAMLRMEAQQGVDHVIATPHFYARHDTPERFLTRRAGAEARLREEMAKHADLPQVSIAAEVRFFSGISDCDALKALTIAGKSSILVEMPESAWTPSMYRELEQIYEKQGLTPVIAHVDRYLSLLSDHGIPERLAVLPVAVQANAGFFLRRTTASKALRMLCNGQIHVLGSDCHDLTRRPPNLGETIHRIRHRLGEDALAQLDQNARRLLSL